MPTRPAVSGRPPLPPGRHRRVVFSMRLSPLEAAELAARAARTGMRMVDYVRQELGWPPSRYGERG